ncbi:MAG: DMT family transporter [Acidimicrobiales bacterium]
MSRRAALLLIVLGTMWGTSYLIIKIVIVHVSPIDVAALRILAGTVAVSFFSRGSMRRAIGLAKGWGYFAALLGSSLASYVVPYLLISWGELHASASIAGMINSTTPIFTAMLTPLFFRGQIPDRYVWTGVVLGLGGTVVVFHPWSSAGGGDLVAEIAILGASICYGVGMLIQKRVLLTRSIGVPRIVTMQLVLASVIVIVLGAPSISSLGHLRASDVLLVIVLGVFNTGLSGLLLLRLNAISTATVSSSVTYVISVVSIAEGALFLGEPLSIDFVVGAIIVFLGVVVLGLGNRVIAWVTTRRTMSSLEPT